ncbi:hypothetical protein [Niallia circulans]|nr:hypothetical protein [Niallia circulans]
MGKVERESANLRKYQPKWRGNQPNSDISAKVERESANLRKYQPK